MQAVNKKPRKKVVIIGAGPAGLFAAYMLSDFFDVTIIEEKNVIGGAGLHSDGKLNFHPKIGGDLTQFVTLNEAWKIIEFIEKKFVEFGAEPGKFNEKKMRELEIKAIKHGIKFIPIKQSHIGSDYLPRVISNFKKVLEKKGVKIKYKTKALDFRQENERIDNIITDKGKLKGDYFIIAPGRGGFEWINQLVKKHNLEFSYNPIDIGVRIEVPNEVFKEIVEDYNLWDPKFYIRTPSYDDFVRTFCTNPGGFVVREYYGDSIFGVNGHAMKKYTSRNTDFAFLVTIKLTEPLENTTIYGMRLAQLTNTLGGGKPLLQRLGDIIRHQRSTWERIRRSYISPTLKNVTPGDISMAYPARIMTDIREGLEALDKVIPGVYSDSTLIYAPEIKFYAIKIKTDKFLRSINLKNLFLAGDGVGVSRGIVGAAATGIIASMGILKDEGIDYKELLK